MEVVVTGLVIGTVALTSAALLVHTTAAKPEYRADLASPPSHILCLQDHEGRCWIRGK